MRTEPPIRLTNRIEVTRRDALKLFGAGMVMLQASCIERTGEEIRPAVRAPETSPGTPRVFATSMVLDGFGTGLLATAYDGRPTKLDGNPAHPASMGATLSAHQAAILDLYDPNRQRAPRRAGTASTWAKFEEELGRISGEIWVVVPPDASPSMVRQLERVRARFPTMRVVHHAALDRREVYRGTQMVFAAPLELQLRFERADRVVSFDADFLASMPMSIRWARDFAARRRQVEPGEQPLRLFVAEPMMTPTGSVADQRMAVPAGEIAAVAVALAAALARRGVASVPIPDDMRDRALARVGDASWIELTATMLARQARTSILIAGDRQPAAVHALVHRMALAVGALNETMAYTRAVLPAPFGEATIEELVGALRAGRAGAVFVLETDPVHDAPAELGLGQLLARAPLSAHLGMYSTATADACTWSLPASHFLETWGDARAADGTLSTIQPLIQPLHDTRSRLQLLAMLAGDATRDDRAIVREEFASEEAWLGALGEGVVARTQERQVHIRAGGDDEILRELAALLELPRPAIEIDLAPSPAIVDGRFANNPWLQELPHPITKQTWGNAALMSPATAGELDVQDGHVVVLGRGAVTIALPAIIVRGHADRCITIELGYGQSSANAPISRGIGSNGSALGSGPILRDVRVSATTSRRPLARTQGDFDRHDRETAFLLDLDGYRRNTEQLAAHRGDQPTLLDSPTLSSNHPQWAMTIDTTICTGCSSCVVACQAENNVPVVGSEGVQRGREMHWLRIDTYVEDTVSGVEVVHQPMLCQHCEMAPCEYVCPVFATTHSPDGLNEMTYNRCVGTRFCSNNCPYKVRRFNWFAYDKPVTTTALQRNPNVTVRERGVMEKCTYCVQRIRAAEIRGRIEGRPIAPGEVVTACQQACPTGAIQFAALQHEDTAMMRWRRSPRLYGALHELGARPRTMYLAKILDRDPEANG